MNAYLRQNWKSSLGVLLIAALLGLWEISSALNWVSQLTLPRLSAVLVTLGDLLWSGELIRELGSSLWRMFAGYFIGVTLGVLIGLLMGSFRAIYFLLEPITEILRPIPSPAYVPIVILFLGIDDEMKVFMVAFAAFFPVLLNAASTQCRPRQRKPSASREASCCGRSCCPRLRLTSSPACG
jgi:ABC-type nitrate/sulfonate/bicarbonate transport system permease component